MAIGNALLVADRVVFRAAVISMRVMRANNKESLMPIAVAAVQHELRRRSIASLE